MSRLQRGDRNPLTLALVAGLWVASIGNWPLWLALSRLPESSTPRGAIFVAAFGLMVAALTVGLLALASWRHVIKPVIAFVVASAAIGAYFMGTFGVVLDPTMMQSVVQTDAREVGDLVSAGLVLNIAVIAGLPWLWLWRSRVERLAWSRQALRNAIAFVGCIGLLAALILALYADLSATMRNHRSMRYLINPVNAYFSLAVLAKESNARPTGPLQPIGTGARLKPPAPGARPPLVVLVIGETARADHFSLNGYARPTNPELAATDAVSFTDVTSCGTHTAASLPCMFSPLTRVDFEARSPHQENLLDLAAHVGLAVLWVDNQSGCKGLCDRVAHAYASEPPPGAPPPASGLCADGECFDEAMLANLDARVAALPQDQRERGVLIVLHQMGSHGPAYFKRSPPGRKPFGPECNTAVLQQCGLDSVVNAYDNSIAYTDHMLARTIRWIEGQQAAYDAALLYVSDHGESLGENNIYLHGLPYAFAPKAQKHVPMVAWLAGGGSGPAAARLGCLRARRDLPLSHDNLFHSVIGLLRIDAVEYDRALDAFAPCESR